MMDLEKNNLKKTSLYDLHIAHNGRMVDFCGYALPIQYSGIVKEHKHTRENASLFDVSHMGQVKISGGGGFEEKAKLLERLFPADIFALKTGQSCYSVLLNENGGIVDDLIITRKANGNDIMIVVNGATKDNDLAIMQAALGDELEFSLENEKSLIALQGPKAAAVLSRFVPEVEDLTFMRSAEIMVEGMELYVFRSGYTGEDGFEISLKNDDALKFVELLLAQDEVEFAGLGARDSLRLEAGLCLYGHDMNEEIDPISASIIFALGKRRRSDGGFVGAEKIQEIIKNGAVQKRVGVVFGGRLPVREGAQMVDENGVEIGKITSGGFSPILEKPIAFAYLPVARAKIGEQVCAIVRGKQVFGEIVKMPFVAHKYKR